MRKEPRKQAAKKNVPDSYLQVFLVGICRHRSLPLLRPQVHQTGGEGAKQGVLELMLVGLQAVVGLGGR